MDPHHDSSQAEGHGKTGHETPGATIFFNGRAIQAREKDTIASALYRSGLRVFSRSFKYHRPRGLLCCAGNCPNCLMQVDGIPNVRACTTLAKDGMRVSPQNVFPSLERDWLSVAQCFGWLMPVGFYYKTFTYPVVWHLVEPMIREVAGLGKIGSLPAHAALNALSSLSSLGYEHLYWHTDIVVIGGGPAGLTAAFEASRSGEQVLLVDDQPELGGHLRYQGKLQDGENWGLSGGESLSGLEGTEIARKLAARVGELHNVRIATNATCFGLYEGNLLGIVQKTEIHGQSTGDTGGAAPWRVIERLIHLRAQKVVVATGATEIPILFENNDIPGVMLSTGVQRLMNLHGLRPCEKAVIVSDEPGGGRMAAELQAADIEVVAVIPRREVIAAVGYKQVTGIRTQRGRYDCDCIIVCGDRVPNAGLIAQAGGDLHWNEEQRAFLPSRIPPFLTVVGEAARIQPNPEFPIPDSRAGKMFVCVCEDVTVKDLCDAITEGFDHIQTLKRYSTVTMGPCQGKMCQLASIAVCARRTAKGMGETGTTTSRPPTAPVSLGALAGCRHHPVRKTPMHSKHEQLGCTWMDMGDWKRPHHYPSPASTDAHQSHESSSSSHSHSDSSRECVESEYRAVRERVGIIDVSTLGKLDLKGKDAPKLLDKVYTNRLSDMKIGRVRHAAICDETGTLLDDGTVSRLADDHYFITTSTGNIEFVQQWLEWWTAGTGWCAHLTNVTSGLAAINVAGPKARETLAKLTECDLATKAFPYMSCRQAPIAHVPCQMLRIGFVGETGWELHFPAEYGEYLWDALMEAGQEFGIRPFGVEAQRLLRLEKKHVIVGVDTDATSNPMAADMPWVAKLEKEDFIGKAAILRFQARGSEEKLVGFVMEDSHVPPDGAAIVMNGRPAGRVTSCRFSPFRGRAVGFAWVQAALAQDGQRIAVHVNGQLGTAKITSEPFYDPKGERLRM